VAVRLPPGRRGRRRRARHGPWSSSSTWSWRLGDIDEAMAPPADSCEPRASGRDGCGASDRFL